MGINREVKKRISPYMKARGFMFSRGSYYYISNEIAYCIGLDAPSSLLYVTAYIMPLYVPCECIYYSYGNRLNSMRGINLPIIDKDSSTEAISEWCDTLVRCIDERIIPFFQQIESPEKLAEYIEDENYLTHFFCPNVFIERLKMYTYLYLRDYTKTHAAKNNYRNLLITSTFLHNTARQYYLSEIDVVDSLIRGSEQDILDFQANTMNITRKILGCRTGDGTKPLKK